MGKQRPFLTEAMAAIGIAALYRHHVAPWIHTWGARREEMTAVLPGDELVDPDALRTTRAVTIDARPRDVWAWLVQLGEGRGGFYSYSLLERAVGADIHNADAIHREWQRLDVGDTIWLARRYGRRASMIVAAVEPESYLVLVSPADSERLGRGEKALGSWSFVLRREQDWTRLLVRGSGEAVGHFWFDIPHFVMEQKMMRGIAARAERTRRGQIVEAIRTAHPVPETVLTTDVRIDGR